MPHIANDNGPARAGHENHVLSHGDSIGHRMLARDRAIAYEARSPAPAANHSAHIHRNYKRRYGFYTGGSNNGGSSGGTGLFDLPTGFFLIFGLWLAALAGAFVYLQHASEPEPRILSFVGFGWASLLLAYISKCQGRDFFRDLGFSTALVSFGAAIFVVTTSYNIPLNPSFLLVGTAFVTVLLANLLKERYFLTVSALAGLAWTGLSLSEMHISQLYWTFPALWAMQMFLCTEFRAKLPLALSTLFGVVWCLTQLFILTADAKISVLMAICTVFTLGVGYSRVGKSMQDNQVISGLFQTHLGWMAAAVSALLLQDYWLMDTPHMPWSALPILPLNAYPFMIQWGVFIALSLLMIGAYGLLRFRGQRQSLIGILSLVGFSAFLPASIAFHPQFIDIAAHYGVSPAPSVGLLIGGAITALALGMMLNGLRRQSPALLFLSLLILSAEAILVMDSLYQAPNNIAIFGFGVAVIALTAGLYAQHAPSSLHKWVQNNA